MITSGEKMDSKATSIFALEAHTSTHAQSVTDANGTDATPSTLAEFITAQFADALCQNVARQLGQGGKK